MEQPTSELSYKGSVSEAITEALTRKKLFVVYISGDDDNSKATEQSTLVDQKVVEFVSKYCVFLHLHEGTVDASQFSAIYPQKSMPSISVVGYNGVMIFQHEGFIRAEIFLESVKKAWESMQLQETTAALLTAALASRNLESVTPRNADSPENGGSSNVDAPSTSGKRADDKNKDQDGRNSSFDVETVEDVQSSSTGTANNINGSSVATAVHEEETHSSDNSLASATLFADCNSGLVNKVSEIASEVEENGGEAEICSAGLPKTSNSIQISDVHLNIRLPSSARLQLISPLTDTLVSVKKYVDDNAGCNLGDFDLAIPYPMKIFTDQDMSTPLSELGFASREALIVVPCKHARVAPRSQPAAYRPSGGSESEAHQGENEGGGYFAFLKRMLSFVNPFSYIGGASHTTAPEPSPNGTFQGSPSRAERYYRPYASNEQNPRAGGSSSTAGSQAPARSGSNVRTLRDVEREGPPSDRNVFWNGNSTEFGGDSRN